jgi:hypothetical protein
MAGDNQYEPTYIFGATCPAWGRGALDTASAANAKSMKLLLTKIIT